MKIVFHILALTFLNSSLTFASVSETTDLAILDAVRSGTYEARTCIASLILNKQVNDRFNREIVRHLKRMGYRHSATSMYKFIAAGKDGVVECLTGPYEDVTIVSHSIEGIGTSLSIETQERGPAVPFPSRIWKKFNKGEYKVHPKVRQLSLINCDLESILHQDNALKLFIANHGIHIRGLPKDGISYLITTFYPGAQIRGAVMGWEFIGQGMALAAQPEWADEIFCLLRATDVFIIGLGSQIRQNCLRGRFSVSLTSFINLGLLRSNKLISLKQPAPGTEFKYGGTSPLGIELGLSTGLSLSVLNLSETVANTQSYGIGTLLFENLQIQDHQVCFSSNQAWMRTACFGNFELLKFALQEAPAPLASSLAVTDQFHNTLLHISAERDLHELSSWLILNGAQMTPNIWGDTPLSIAVKQLRFKTFSDFRKHHKRGIIALPVNHQNPNENGDTLLHWIARHPHPELYLGKMKDLLNLGADPFIRNLLGESAIDLFALRKAAEVELHQNTLGRRMRGKKDPATHKTDPRIQRWNFRNF